VFEKEPPDRGSVPRLRYQSTQIIGQRKARTIATIPRVPTAINIPSWGSEHVHNAPGLMPGSVRLLLTDGYAAYRKHARKLWITRVQCWVHFRRALFEVLRTDPQATEDALKQIAALCEIEDQGSASAV
jgi:hypothetical protein